jgi:integrase
MPTKQKNGLYRAKVRIGVAPDGKEIVKYAAAKTLKLLEKEKAEIISTFVDGSCETEDCLFQDYVMQWYENSKKPFIRNASQVCYESMLNKYMLPAFGERQMRAIRAIELQKWLNDTCAGRSNTFITIAITILKHTFATAHADGYIARNVAAALKKPHQGEPKEKRAFTQQESAAILYTMETHPEGLLLGVLYSLGVRRGEALGLQWSDIDFEGKEAHIQRDIDFQTGKEDELKTDAANRYVPIPEILLKLLEEQRGIGNTYIFHSADGSPLSKASFERMYVRLMVDAGLAVPREQKQNKSEKQKRTDWDENWDIRARWVTPLTPHYFRHNYITMLYNAGFDAVTTMRIVGHTDYQTTVNIYTHLKSQHHERVKMSIDSITEKIKTDSQMLTIAR